MLHGHVKAKDHLKGHVKMDLGTQEHAFTLRFELSARPLQLIMEQNLTRLGMGGFLVPRLLDDFFESRHLDPEVLKFE